MPAAGAPNLKKSVLYAKSVVLSTGAAVIPEFVAGGTKKYAPEINLHTISMKHSMLSNII